MAHNEQAFCKIRSSHTVGCRTTYTIGILGVFNTSRAPQSEFLGLDDIFEILPEGQFLVASFQSGNYRKADPCKDQLPPIFLDLAFWGWDILTVYPLSSFRLSEQGPGSNIEVAVLGLLCKMTGAAALTRGDLWVDDQLHTLNLEIGLKALGTLGK